MTLALRFAARSDVGLLRGGNEDSVYAGPRLLAVADGMGGHAAGEVASALVIAGLAPLDEDVPGPDLAAALREAVQSANRHLADMVAGDDELAGMGTTLTALLWSGSTRLGLVHVGDSRAYLLRDDELRQITTDHTFVQSLVDQGRISAEDAGSHPQRSLLTRALDGTSVDPDISVREVQPGDRYLLCTDGLSAVVSDATIATTLEEEPDPARAADRLVGLALRAGGPDNVTCVVADVVDDHDVVAADPVVAGAAAADDVDAVTSLPDTSAGRAAATRHRTPQRHHAPPAAQATGRRRRRRRVPVVVLGIFALLVGAVVAAAYVRSQYYVADAGSEVAIYRGLDGSLAGIDLHRVAKRTDVPVDQLPDFQQARVRDGISADGRAHANRIVDRLRDSWRQQVCPSPAPTSTTTPIPRPAPRVTPTAPAATAGPGRQPLPVATATGPPESLCP